MATPCSQMGSTCEMDCEGRAPRSHKPQVVQDLWTRGHGSQAVQQPWVSNNMMTMQSHLLWVYILKRLWKNLKDTIPYISTNK